MKKSEVLEFAKASNFELDKEEVDLSENTFRNVRNVTTDLVFILRDQKDENFFLMGIYPSVKADKLMGILKDRK